MALDDLLGLLGLDPEDPEVVAVERDDERFAVLMKTLHQLRRRQGLTQAVVARRMGTTQSAVSELERTSGDPRIRTVQRYARAVNASIRFVTVSGDAGWGEVAEMPQSGHVARGGGSVKLPRSRLTLAARDSSEAASA